VRAEPTNNRTAGIDTNHSTMFTLLLKFKSHSRHRHEPLNYVHVATKIQRYV